MNDFLALTLCGETPAQLSGETASLHWQWVGEGLLTLTPKEGYSQTMVLSAGIHGNETAPIELLCQLTADVLSGSHPLSVRLLLVLGNPAAMRAGKRYLHSDMNRMFGGRYDQFASSGETARAAQLQQALEDFFLADAELGTARYHYDLHTAIRESRLPRFGLLPFQPRSYSALLLANLNAAELDALVVHQEPSGTFSHFSSEYLGAASCTLELGKARPFGTNDLQQFSAIDRTLRALVSETALPLRQGGPMRLFRVEKSLIRHSEAFQLHLTDDTANFTRFVRGTLLCEQPGEAYRIGHEHEWILFPNPNVALGLRAGIVLTEIAPGSALQA